MTDYDHGYSNGYQQARADQSEVIFTSFGRPVLSTLYIDMQLVIQKHQGRTSLSEVLGVLELVKHGLIEGHK